MNIPLKANATAYQNKRKLQGTQVKLSWLYFIILQKYHYLMPLPPQKKGVFTSKFNKFQTSWPKKPDCVSH